ncbi:hypothetical protein [Vibrio phage CKB-S1]|nr:hypothetical protein [Vibrio phage CKB-S1]
MTKDDLIAEAVKLDPEYKAGKKNMDEITADIEAMKAAAEQGEAPYKIAKGKSLVVHHKGLLNEGDEIKADWLPNGEDQLKDLIAKGHVVK